MNNQLEKKNNYHQRVYAVVRRIPKGKVATYGQVAAMAGRCTARMAGYAMAATPENQGIPWHRVINSQGRISVRADGKESIIQRKMLELEGVEFSAVGKVDLKQYQWTGDDNPFDWGNRLKSQ